MKTVSAICVVLVLAAGLSCRKSAPPPASAPASRPATTTASAPASDASVPTAGPPAVSIDPDSFQGLMDRANAALSRGDCTLAAELFAEAADSAANTGEGDGLLAMKGEANALTLAQRHEEAAAIYQRLIEVDPFDQTSRFNLAVAMARLRRFSEAEAIYLDLLSEQEDFLQARYNLASLYQVQGKLTQARDQWQQVVRQAPRLSSAQAALAEVLLELGQPREAMAAYGVAAKLVGDDPVIWRGFAAAARAAGEFQQAALAARCTAQLVPRDATAWRLLGDVLLDLHRSTGDERYLSQAVDAWRRSLALDGTQADLRGILAAHAGSGKTTRPARAPSGVVIDNWPLTADDCLRAPCITGGKCRRPRWPLTSDNTPRPSA